jgi:hydroxyethylthiazole kinase-like uncharacterized protein yjeF
VTPAPWLEPLLDAKAMRETDRWAIEQMGIPARELMERAGEGLARVTTAVAPQGRVAIVCGKGNNGGDGLVTARLLRAAGREVDVLLLWPREQLSTDAAEQLDALTGAPPEPFDARRLDGAAVVVDAMLGTGFAGAPRDPVARAIEAINAVGVHVVAADVPSGVNASTGAVEGAAVRASATATFHRAKPGLWISPGKRHAGVVHVLDIGIPPGAPAEPAAGLIGDAILDEIPRRGAGSTKFSSGNVVVVGGARGLTGAPCMAALAAMRAGAGYVTVATPASQEVVVSVRLMEAMVRAMPENDGALSLEALEPVLAAAARADAVVLGPGLSREPGAQALTRDVAGRIEAPLVIDADGLNALAGHLDGVLAHRTAPTVLTPHAGELGRLLEVDSSAVAADRLDSVRAAARQTGAHVVLKGDDTIVAAPDGRVAISRGDAPASSCICVPGGWRQRPMARTA